jgi:hypothetical protein
VRGGASPSDALERLVGLHVAFAIDEPYLITVHDRDLASLPRQDGHRVRRLQRAYVEIWASVLRQLDPRLGAADSRARAHALFGLLNSTRHSAAEVDAPTMASLLREMSLRAAGWHRPALPA